MHQNRYGEVVPTWAKVFDLVEALDAVVEFPHRLLRVRSRLDLKQEDGGSDVNAIRKRENAVVHRKRPTEEIEDCDDGRRRRNAFHQVAFDLGAALLCASSPACEHRSVQQYLERMIETAGRWLAACVDFYKSGSVRHTSL